MVKVKIKAKPKVSKRKFPVRFKSPEFLNFDLGESNVTDLNNLIGKKVIYNLMFITKNAKHQNIMITFRVIDVSSGEAKTEVAQYEVTSNYLTRILKGGTLVEDRFVVSTSDGREIIFKPFILTKGKVSRAVASAIRKRVRELVDSFSSKSSDEEIFKSAINGTLQSSIKADIKKIYPIKFLDFRKITLKK